MSIDKAIVDLGPSEMLPGLLMLLCVESDLLTILMIEPFSFERLSAIVKSSNFKYPMNEEHRLSMLDQAICQHFATYDALFF